jgi:hypothetical protein
MSAWVTRPPPSRLYVNCKVVLSAWVCFVTRPFVSYSFVRYVISRGSWTCVIRPLVS